ncbi:3-oxo-5-alpha-steroid 4-dehydrogenase-domain-containing protein [Phellopilus nigrolimitatus]|nr:3-oxo-5-alpha-steroid 4-dehydrogenase-domain-containing protein [Phellopilus nigrolimitatus]
MVSVTITAAGKPPALALKLPFTVVLPDKTLESARIEDVKGAITAQFPKFHTSRQKLSLTGDKKALADEDSLAKAGVTDGGELTIKDLGRQISWRTVFIVEYARPSYISRGVEFLTFVLKAGPLVIHPLFYYLPKLIYGGDVQHSLMQRYAFTLIMLHFLKREYETLSVHRFSKATMPFFNLFKNSGHYHILSGILLAFALYRPKYAALSPVIRDSKRDSLSFLWFWTAIFVFAEISNLKTHLTLRDLRPEGSRKRAIPYGYGFNLVSCPNYFFESLAWFAISCMTGSYAAWLFFFAGTVQMALWAIKKHKLYRKEFGNQYPKGRKIMFPFIF